MFSKHAFSHSNFKRWPFLIRQPLSPLNIAYNVQINLEIRREKNGLRIHEIIAVTRLYRKMTFFHDNWK